MAIITYGELLKFCNDHPRIPKFIEIEVDDNFISKLKELDEIQSKTCSCYEPFEVCVPTFNANGEFERMDKKCGGFCTLLGFKEVNCNGGRSGCSVNWDETEILPITYREK